MRPATDRMPMEVETALVDVDTAVVVCSSLEKAVVTVLEAAADDADDAAVAVTPRRDDVDADVAMPDSGG
jgi:hypothetical protein